MKTIIALAILVTLPGFAGAKIGDFNELIQENTQSQKQLHSEIKTQILEAKKEVAEGAASDRVIKIQTAEAEYISPMKKDLLVYEKEKNFHRPSDNKQLKRLANEISSMNQD